MKYILTFLKPSGETVQINNLKMKDLIEQIKNLIKENYNIDDNLYSVNNQIIYNIMNNRKCNKFIKKLIKVSKYTV